MATPYNSLNWPIFTPYGVPAQNAVNYPQNSSQAPQGSNLGIIWVQGESGAKSYLVGAGNSVLLMDSEQSRFYIKSTDASGMPAPLRVFEYSEISAKNGPLGHTEQNLSDLYITREEFETRLNALELTRPAPKKEIKDGKSTV